MQARVLGAKLVPMLAYLVPVLTCLVPMLASLVPMLARLVPMLASLTSDHSAPTLQLLKSRVFTTAGITGIYLQLTIGLVHSLHGHLNKEQGSFPPSGFFQ